MNYIKSNGNIKVGNMGTISKLMGDDPIYVKSMNTAVVGTCGHNCAGCKNKCYVKKSYRYPSVILSHARTTIAFRENLVSAFNDMDKQLTNKRKPFEIVRINQSGEIESTAELNHYYELAAKHPETKFYLYTKNFVALKASDLESMPENITILISVWHEYGIDTYNELKHMPNVKAFVYMDGYNYEMEVGTMCNAYDKNGKMDHRITCDKCRKCFDRVESHKVVGCYEH